MNNTAPPTRADDVLTGGIAGDFDSNLQLLSDIPVRVSVEVGSVSKTLAEILRFQQGQVVELDRAASEPLDIMVNGALVARGEVVTVDGRFGIRVTELPKNGVRASNIERRGA